MPAGARVPVKLTVRQEQYCRHAMGVSRFCYNMAVATHRFHRVNRLRWPSWQDIYKAFNDCKHEDYPFVTEVVSRVAEGAFMDFGKAIDNWRNPKLKARAPRFKRRKLTRTGSFRAASGVDQIRYNGKRRIQLPGLRSVKLDCTLPKGIYHDAHIKHENGQWYLCLKLWREPEPRPENDNRRAGAIDTGINPLGTDSDGQEYENPRATYQVEKKLHRWQRAQARRQRGSRGWWEAQRRIDRCHRRIRGLRHNAQHQMTSKVTRKFKELVIEDLNVAGMMQGPTPKAPGRRRHGGNQAATALQEQLEIYPGNHGINLVSQQQNLQHLRDRERETQAGTDLDMRELRDQPRPECECRTEPEKPDQASRQGADAP